MQIRLRRSVADERKQSGGRGRGREEVEREEEISNREGKEYRRRWVNRRRQKTHGRSR